MADGRQEPEPAAHGGVLAVAAARAHGVSTMFTLSGGHVFPLYDGAVTADPPMRLVDVRHEQTAVGRSGPIGYLRGVWEELKKVVWPARDELVRMTGIVIATVIIFAALVGGADYLLSLGVKQAVATQAASAPAPPAPTTAPLATAAPTAAPTVSP